MNVTTWLLAELQRGLLLPFLLPPLPPPEVLLRVPPAAAAAAAAEPPSAAAAAAAAACAAAAAAAVDEQAWYLPFSVFGILHSFVLLRFLDFWALLSPPSVMQFAEMLVMNDAGFRTLSFLAVGGIVAREPHLQQQGDAAAPTATAALAAAAAQAAAAAGAAALAAAAAAQAAASLSLCLPLRDTPGVCVV
ncbi:hypothetical protein Emag_002217 [Eimeria magna]